MDTSHEEANEEVVPAAQRDSQTGISPTDCVEGNRESPRAPLRANALTGPNFHANTHVPTEVHDRVTKG